jgi:glycosyltransferase involved in cell wall biosynthesis
MQILIVHSRYRSGPASGENRVVEDEARLLREAGHHVDVFAPGVGELTGIGRIRTAAEAIWSVRATKEVADRIRRSRPAIVHAHNLFPALSPAVLRVANERAATVLTLHNYRLLCLPGTFLRSGRICEDCLGRLPWPGVVHGCYQGSVAASGVLATSLQLHQAIGSFRGVHLYVAISEFVRRKHVEAGMAADRVAVKPHFAWSSPRREGPGDFFLYLGRLSPEKGVSTLLEAWRRIKAKLVIVGNGPDAARLRSLAPSNAEFWGPVAPGLVSDLLSRSRALIVPSLSHEGAGKVVLEAYAAGVPVLASRAGGLPEVVQDGISGLLVPPGDPAALVEAVEHLLDDPASERMGEAGWALWEKRYSPEHGLARLEEVYRRASESVR